MKKVYRYLIFIALVAIIMPLLTRSTPKDASIRKSTMVWKQTDVSPMTPVQLVLLDNSRLDGIYKGFYTKTSIAVEVEGSLVILDVSMIDSLQVEKRSE